MDSDQAIEAAEGRSIPEIFESAGEAAFRAMERSFVESGHPDSGCLIALGGGLVTQSGMIGQLQRKGILICLYASLESILERTARNRARPLLEGEDREKRVRELYAARQSIYRSIPLAVSTDSRTPADVARRLAGIYLDELRRRQSR